VADASSSNAYTQAINNAVASAKTMLGKNEVPNHAELQSYLRDGGQDLDPHKVAWCAAFVSASLQKAGLPVPTQVVKDSAFGPGAYAPNYLTYGSAVDPKNIQAGDILVNNNGSHVGFAEGAMRQGPNGPEVQMLAGNERDPSGQYAPGSYTSPTGAVGKRSQVGMVGERWVPLSQYSARRYVPADDASQPAAAPSQPSAGGAAPSGTTLNSAPAAQSGGLNLGNLSAAIKQQESNGNYSAVNRTSGALGAYQIMPFNLPEWGKAAGYEGITPEQFLANPKAQDDIANARLRSYANQYGNARDVASVWYGGPKAVGNPNISGGKGYPTTGAYANEVLAKYNALGGGTPGTTLNSNASGAPAAAAGGPAAPAAPGTAQAGGGLAGALPGFEPNSPGAKMTAAGLQQLAGGGSQEGQGDDKPPPMPSLPTAPPAQPVGGQMMLGPGGQNTLGRTVAEQMLGQQGLAQGFLTQPSLAANLMGGLRAPVPSTIQSTIQPMAAGQATGMPSLPGTTLNSPSQLQMALMTGAMNPYDLYSSGAYGVQGLPGST
jgi:hypothetical protein